MNFLDLFAGIGGFSLGLERAGMTCVGQVEIDEYCQWVLAAHWPLVVRYGDIRKVDGSEFKNVDLVCGGFPCQPFSCAGKRRGLADDRYRWPDMFRIIKRIRPRWLLLENVPGIVRMALDGVLADLEGEAYTCQPFIIPACAVDAPHRRDRVWFLAYSESIGNRRTARTLDETEARSEKQVGGLFSHCKSENGEPVISNACCDIVQGSADIGDIGKMRKVGHEQPMRLFQSAWDKFPTQSPVCGRNDGVSNRMDRIKALGNAVVPQVVEEIGRAIIKSAIPGAEPPQDRGQFSVQLPLPGSQV